MNNYFDAPANTTKKDANSDKSVRMENGQFYQRGLGLKKEVQGILKHDYYSNIVTFLRENEFQVHAGGLTLYLAREFGFCYGVDRAVDYAYQTRERFPDRRIFLTGEIIHNPHVNKRLIKMGIQFLSGQYCNGTSIEDLRPEDVVILPAFGVSIQQFQALKKRESILVDTTCGSVLNVWKRVIHYAKNGYTSIIHGKYYHEETIATSSQALKFANGRFLIVRDLEETQKVCDYLIHGGDRESFMSKFGKAVSPEFDPDRDLNKIGVANQTTMLSSESLAIADELKKAMRSKFGSQKLHDHFLTFDTICSATQERQDAVVEMVERHDLNLVIVVGGFNSSNTNHLAEITSKYTHTYHIDDPDCILDKNTIKHKLIDSEQIETSRNWLPTGEIKVGITAGASTPNNKIGKVVEKILSFRNVSISAMLGTVT
ncbi:MAG: 4-hydroxy-3-methylbut-2-enyl diphosphate reductase [bacterium]